VKRILMLVEGQTEENFVRDLLTPHLGRFDIHPTTVLVETKRDKSGLKYKGGVSNYQKIRRGVIRLLHDTNAVAVTTMLDFYGLPRDFPGRDEARKLVDCQEKVARGEQAFAEDINDRRFIPYLMLHEYEAMLFTAPARIAAEFPEENRLKELNAIRAAFATPEEINDDPNTAPSKRLRNLFGAAYQKPLHGVLIAASIGLTAICEECRHFREWLTALESL
jgi:hypothetical protein